MTSTRTPRRRRKSPKTDAFLGLLIPLVVIGLAVADFARDGHVDKYLIGALLIFGLGALGWRIDVILEKYLEVRGGYSDDRRRQEEEDERLERERWERFEEFERFEQEQKAHGHAE